MKSIDGGKTWTTLRPPHGDNHDMWIDPTNPKRFIASNDGGATVTINGGETWTDRRSPDGAVLPRDHDGRRAVSRVRRAAGQHDRVRVEPAGSRRPGRVAAACEQVFYSVGGGESGYIANDPKNPDIFYAGSYGGLITPLQPQDRPAAQQVNPYPDNPMGYASQGHRGALPVDVPDRLLADRSERALRRLAARLEDDQRRARAGRGSAPTSRGTIRRRWATRAARSRRTRPASRPTRRSSRSRRRRRTATSSGPDPTTATCRSRATAGKTWKNVTPKDLPEFARISLVEASPFRPGTAYVAANRYQHDDFAPYVYRTDDYGETWTKIVTGIAPRDFARAIREDPKRAEAAVPRHRARHLRVVRRRGELAVAAAEPARHAGARHQGRSSATS